MVLSINLPGQGAVTYVITTKQIIQLIYVQLILLPAALLEATRGTLKMRWVEGKLPLLISI